MPVRWPMRFAAKSREMLRFEMDTDPVFSTMVSMATVRIAITVRVPKGSYVAASRMARHAGLSLGTWTRQLVLAATETDALGHRLKREGGGNHDEDGR